MDREAILKAQVPRAAADLRVAGLEAATAGERAALERFARTYDGIVKGGERDFSRASPSLTSRPEVKRELNQEQAGRVR